MCNCNRDFIKVNTINITVFGDVLLLTIPINNYFDCETVRICTKQSIPTNITSDMLVSIQVGDSGEMYPFHRCGHNVYADQIRTNHCYCTKVATDTSTFNYIGGDCLCSTSHISPPVLVVPPAEPIV